MSVTLIIILITTAVSIAAFSNQPILSRLMFNPYVIRQRNQYDRFITSGFIHANWLHLLINMFVLYSFGTWVETEYKERFHDAGTLLYILLYVLALALSSISTYFKHQNDPRYNSLGASGAVSAVLFASIVFKPMSKIHLYGIIGIPGIVAGAAWIVYSIYMARRGSDNINHDAHLYGAIFGFAFTIVLEPELFMHFINSLMSGLGA